MQNLGTNKGLKEILDLSKMFTKYLYKLKLKLNNYISCFITYSFLKLGFAFFILLFLFGKYLNNLILLNVIIVTQTVRLIVTFRDSYVTVSHNNSDVRGFIK